MRTGSQFNHSSTPATHVGIVGGGLAGTTIALRLADLGLQVTLLEEQDSLVNTMPMCHLHAGGNLYRELSDDDCITLLRESVDMLRAFPQAVNVRPTVIAVPAHDAGAPGDLIARLELLKTEYSRLVASAPENRVLGEPEEYFKTYDLAALESLAAQAEPAQTESLDDWMIPVARHIDLQTCKLPLITVRELGLCVFRLAATATLALDRLSNCRVLTGYTVTAVSRLPSTRQWQINYKPRRDRAGTLDSDGCQESITVDYLVNACGYRTGTLDDMQGFKRDRSMEFKAAYLVRWPGHGVGWPEVVFHGERGTPRGMAQLSPFDNGYFLLHGMTKDITLFKKGFSSNRDGSSQPRLDSDLQEKLDGIWSPSDIEYRSRNAINHIAQFIPGLKTALAVGQPLFGVQQIPGRCASLRVAHTSFEGTRYARSEIVKANSAVKSANAIIGALDREHLLPHGLCSAQGDDAPYFSSTQDLTLEEITKKAEKIAARRCCPPELAHPYGSNSLKAAAETA